MSKALTPQERAKQESFTVVKADEEHYNVRNDTSGKIYTVTVVPALGTSWKCTCPDHMYRARECKHQAKVNMELKEQKQEESQKKAPSHEVEECECTEDFPCWPCYREGKRNDF